MSEVGAKIIETEETQESGVKYLNINISNNEVERNPDIVRLCADAGILEYARPCDNAVSRQTVLDAIGKWVREKQILVLLSATEIASLFDSVRGLPPVNSQPKSGHWILQPSNKEQGERDFIWWKCSRCGQVIFSETEKDRREFQAFCSRCGAKMVDSQERE